MVDKDTSVSPRNRDQSHSENNILAKLQNFFDRNIRVIRNVSWIIGGVGLVVILRRTYALNHFTKRSMIPEVYFQNNVTLSGKVVDVHKEDSLGVQHLPLLWRARTKISSYPCLKLNISGVKLQKGGVEYLTSRLENKEIKFQLLGKDGEEKIESIIYQKGWFKRTCVNEDIIKKGLATAKHVSSLSNVDLFHRLTYDLVTAEVNAIRKKVGIWKDDVDDSDAPFKIWSWLRNKLFK